MNGLSPGEIKIIFVKMVAFQAFEVHRHHLLVSAGFSLNEFLQNIASSCDVNRANNNDETFSNYVAWYCSALEGTLLTQRPGLIEAIRNFAETLRSYIRHEDLEEQLNTWLSRMTASVINYSHSLHPLPAVSLRFEVLPESTPPLAGRTNQSSGRSRIITLMFDLIGFDLVSSFSIPWVLSHEFWCHCLSDLEATEKTGCDPSAAFEEGWMDWVQDGIIRENIQNILGTEDPVPVIMHWQTYIEERKKKLSDNSLWGAKVAARFQGLMQQKLGDLDPISLFRQMSLDLNALSLNQDVKGRFVDEIGARLSMDSPLIGGRFPNEDAMAIQKRRELAILIKHSLCGASCRVMDLLKLLKIKIL